MLCKIKKYICPQTGKIRYGYNFRFLHDNREVRLRKQGFISESDARDSLEMAYYGIRHGHIDPPARGARPGRKRTRTVPVTVQEVYDAVLVHWSQKVKENSFITYTRKLQRYVLPHLRDHEFARLTDSEISSLYALNPDVSPTSISAPLQAWFARAKEAGYQVPAISDHVWKKGKTQHREEYLTAEEVQILLDKCKPEYKHLFALMIHTGARVGEALGLDWCDVSLSNRTIKIERQLCTNTRKITSPKSGKSRTIPMTDTMLQILQSYAAVNGSSWIVKGRMFLLGYDVIQREIRRCREFIGKEIVVHSLRHTAASLMIQANIPIEKIGAILGQSSTSITAQYAHLSTDSLREAVSVLPSVAL